MFEITGSGEAKSIHGLVNAIVYWEIDSLGSKGVSVGLRGGMSGIGTSSGVIVSFNWEK